MELAEHKVDEGLFMALNIDTGELIGLVNEDDPEEAVLCLFGNRTRCFQYLHSWVEEEDPASDIDRIEVLGGEEPEDFLDYLVIARDEHGFTHCALNPPMEDEEDFIIFDITKLIKSMEDI